jgi:hypothetical protein
VQKLGEQKRVHASAGQLLAGPALYTSKDGETASHVQTLAKLRHEVTVATPLNAPGDELEFAQSIRCEKDTGKGIRAGPRWSEI